MTVDPKVHALAGDFVDDVLEQLQAEDLKNKLSLAQRAVREANRQRLRATLVDRAAAAMQQAIEGECLAIEQELYA